MRSFFLTGQRSFGNRGCEALVRGTARILKEHFGDVAILVPSEDIALDARQWPGHEDYGVFFVPAYAPRIARPWKVVPTLPLGVCRRMVWPFPLPARLRSLIRDADAVLSVGGDNYSLDYFSLPVALMAQDRVAMMTGRPVVLWGASLGPFTVDPAIVRVLTEHLLRMRLITIRETLSFNFMASLGFLGCRMVGDPAFVMDAEAVDAQPFWPRPSPAGVVGINLSPLVHGVCRSKNGSDLGEEAAGFIRGLVGTGYSVLLVPHVAPLDGGGRNSDDAYMRHHVLARTGEQDGRVRMAPATLNAAQLKSVIGGCDYFVGARTHSTIAAFCAGVPTLSISYSQKALGLNLDLLGHTDHVVPASRLSTPALSAAFDRLVADAPAVRTALAANVPLQKEKSRQAAVLLEGVLG